MTQTSLPKVAILATGGTIAGRAGSSLSHEYKAGSAIGAELVVFTGTGAGMLSDVEKDIVRESRERGDGIVFVRSNRLGNGRVLAHGEHDELGIVPADNLNPQKARILLMLALSRAHDPAELQRIFAQY